MTGFRPIVVSLLLVALFSLALIIGGESLVSQNSDKTLFSGDSDLQEYVSFVNQTIQNYSLDMNGTDSSFSESSVTTTGNIPYIDSISGTWKVIKRSPKMLYEASIGIVMSKLLSDQQKIIVITVIGIILAMTIILAVWKLIATGESDK